MENRVNKINERALRLVYADSRNVYLSVNSVSIHQRNLQTLAPEIFKANQGISTERILDLFHFVKNSTTLEIITCCKKNKKVKVVYFGTERISSLKPKKWKLLPAPPKNEILPE